MDLWSGLSESNRHLNLGKVPYYHYTKAAQRPSFYSMSARQRQALRAAPVQHLTDDGQKNSGDLGNPGGLHDGRTALALREARGFILVGVDTPELFPVGIINTDEEVMMFAAAIAAERSLATNARFFRLSFCHVDHLI